MGFLTNVLEYGWHAGCIITEAERTADRICKGIKATIIEDEEDKDASEEREDGDVDVTGFKVIFHPEWLQKEARKRWERMRQEEHCEAEAVGNIKDAYTDIMNYLHGQSEINT